MFALRRPELSDLRSLPVTYDEAAATGGVMPTGYRLVEVNRVIGHGHDTFERAGDRLLSWSMHRKLGFRVSTDHSRVREQAVALLSIGPLRIPCRVVLVYD